MSDLKRELQAFRSHFGNCMKPCRKCGRYHHEGYTCPSCGYDNSGNDSDEDEDLE